MIAGETPGEGPSGEAIKRSRIQRIAFRSEDGCGDPPQITAEDLSPLGINEVGAKGLRQLGRV